MAGRNSLASQKNRRVGPTVKTDFDFADDIALVSNLEDQAQELLHRVEGACGDVGLKAQCQEDKSHDFQHRSSRAQNSMSFTVSRIILFSFETCKR